TPIQIWSTQVLGVEPVVCKQRVACPNPAVGSSFPIRNGPCARRAAHPYHEKYQQFSNRCSVRLIGPLATAMKIASTLITATTGTGTASPAPDSKMKPPMTPAEVSSTQ